MLDKLKELGVATVIVRFTGSGDEGYVDDVEARAADGGAVELPRALSSECEDLVEHAAWDWYNNEGGGGTATLDVATGEVEIDGYYNEIREIPVDPQTVSVS